MGIISANTWKGHFVPLLMLVLPTATLDISQDPLRALRTHSYCERKHYLEVGHFFGYKENQHTHVYKQMHAHTNNTKLFSL